MARKLSYLTTETRRTQREMAKRKAHSVKREKRFDVQKPFGRLLLIKGVIIVITS